jgi:hypothetical protein
LARIGREVSLTYAAAVTEALNAANLKAGDLAAIAAHGQTLFHEVPLHVPGQRDRPAEPKSPEVKEVGEEIAHRHTRSLLQGRGTSLAFAFKPHCLRVQRRIYPNGKPLWLCPTGQALL